MHVALMIDQATWGRERDWISRTVVGLLASGVRISRFIPHDVEDNSRQSLATAYRYRETGLPWTLRSSIATIVDSLGAANVPDLIHVIGPGAWPQALKLAGALKIPLAVSIWSRDEVAQTRSIIENQQVAAFLPASAALAELLKPNIESDLIQTIPIGVYCAKDEHLPLRNRDNIVSVVIAGFASPASDVRRVLEAAAGAARQYPALMFFVDLRSGVDARAWKAAEDLGILDRLSNIPPVEENRQIITQADLLILPSPMPRSGSFILECMASPMVMLAARDELIDILCHPDLAYIQDRPTAESWGSALNQVLSEPEQAQKQALQARTYVANHHAMSAQVEDLIRTYERIVTGGAIELPTAE